MGYQRLMKYRTRIPLACGTIFLLGLLLFEFKDDMNTEETEISIKVRNSKKAAESFIGATNQQGEQQTTQTPTETEPKKFVYHVQTKKCLPRRLLHKDYLGYPSLCQCDVLVFSYKEACNDNEFEHVEYLHGENASWAAGRNILYRRSQARNHQYLYYIFLDDDIEFGFKDAYMPSHTSPLRAFEEFLFSYEPAIGVANYQVHHNADTMMNKIRQICPTNGKWKKLNATPLYIPVVHFDSSFNAFHHDAINYILPYPTEYDNICWWHSQRYVIAAAELVFRGHSVMYSPVEAHNPVHSEYPRNDKDAKTIWSSIVRALSKHVPKEFQCQAWIQAFIDDPVQYTENSLGMCFHLPSHHPINPYSHFLSP
ncbi:hypothetical protein QZH41_002299 [Actinostola sp. cb2023]|nr:hypothetical protein QZH41_002299 [Actinostola sp. cb2023]